MQPRETAITPCADKTWLIEEHGFVPAREHEVESVMAVANGYLGVRASLAEGSFRSDPATYLANVFVDSSTGPVLARAPQWLPLQASIDGRPVALKGNPILEHSRFLDMRQGLLWRDWTFSDESGRQTRILGYRFASLVDPHVMAQVVYLWPLNYSGELLFETGIGGAPGYGTVFWKHEASQVAVSTATADLGRGRQVVAAGRAVLVMPDGKILEPEIEANPSAVHERWRCGVEAASGYRLDRILYIYATPDDPAPVVRARAEAAGWNPTDLELMARKHCDRWREEWRCGDVRVEGDESAQRALRFAAFHMSGCVQSGAKSAAVGPRGLTGGGYGGHVFWDTEIYVMPFFLYTQPEKARAVLGYRYQTLPAAREEAKRINCRGANYAWESAESGREITPEWILTPDGQHARVYSGDEEIHVTADVAYAVWKYWEATQDLHYLAGEGAEILFETARFWVSRGQIEDDALFHLRTVMGPDEYHPNTDDNAFTNGMARYNLQCAGEAFAILDRLAPDKLAGLRKKLALRESEIEQFCDIAGRMAKGRTNQAGVIEQFAGFWDLDPTPPDEKVAALLMETEALRSYQVVKQPDLIMLFALHPEWFSRQTQEVNFRYYEPLTWHGSSLSPGIHALVAAQIGDLANAERYFKQTMEIDLALEGNASVGVHLASLGSLWMSAVFGFGGVRFEGDTVRVTPNLPPAWNSLAFRLRYRGRVLAFHIDSVGAKVDVEEGAPLEILVMAPPRTGRSDAKLDATLSPRGL